MRLLCRIMAAVFLVILFNTAFVDEVFGTAFDNNGVGLRGFTMAGFAGVADDASAIYYNPGGLVFSDRSLNIEMYGYFIFTEFKYTTPLKEDRSDETPFIPGLFVSKTYEDWAFGIGAYVPFGGGGTAYENFQHSPNTLETVMGIFAITPAVAYKLLPNLSVGIGLSAYIGMMESKITPPGAPGEVNSEYEGMAGYGGNIGLMYKAMENLNVGFSMRSPVSVKIDGTEKVKINGALIESDSEVEYTLPYYFTLGVGYELDPDLMLGFSACYMLWEDMDKLTFTTESVGNGETTSIENEVRTHYKNSWVLGIGAEYAMMDNVTMIAGLKFEQGATEDEGLNPGTNDIDRLALTVGGGYSITQSIEIDVTGVYVTGFEKEYNSQTFDQDHVMVESGFKFKF
jgi:long-chain fatty acid transport protein